MALSDEVASRVLGELHLLTKHIDEQSRQLNVAASVAKQSAEQIKKNSEDAVKNAKESARQALFESAAKFQLEFSKTAAQSLNDVANAVAVKSAAKWVLAGVLLAGFLTVTAGWVGYNKGNEAGRAEGYSRSRNEVAANSWANSEEGLLARKLAEAGSIKALATCEKKRGWQLEKNNCYPVAAKDGNVYGWKIQQ